MNIWIVNHYAIPPSQPGITRHFMLGRELVRRGHNVAIIACSFDHFRQEQTRLNRGERWRMEQIEGVRFLWLRAPSYKGNGAARIVNMAAFAAHAWFPSTTTVLPQPDVILGSSPTLFAAWAALRIARRHRVPFLLEIRDLWPQSLVDLGKVSESHVAVLLLKILERSLYRNADGIVTLLAGSTAHLIKNGAAPEGIVWLPNGVDLSVAPLPVQPPQQSRFTITYAGAHGLANGLGSIVEAAAILQAEAAAHIRLRLIGDGPDKVRLVEKAAAMKLGNIEFHPAVAKDDIFEALAQSDALIATLRNAPLFRHGISPNKLYDYMAVGRPVILAADTTGDPISASACGFVIAPEAPRAMADAILALAALPPQVRWEMGLRGRRFVEQHHSVSVLVDRLEGLLKNVVSSEVHQSMMRDERFANFGDVEQTGDSQS